MKRILIFQQYLKILGLFRQFECYISDLEQVFSYVYNVHELTSCIDTSIWTDFLVLLVIELDSVESNDYVGGIYYCDMSALLIFCCLLFLVIFLLTTT